MGSTAIKPSVFVSRLLRTHRKRLKLTLNQVSERMAQKGHRIPTSTLARIERGKVDPGVQRLHLLLDLYGIPPHLVADLVELETLAVKRPASKDLASLYRDGVEHWKKGDIPEGLAHLFAIREHVPDNDAARLLQQNATLTFAVAARNLGKYRLARQMVDDLLCEPPDPSILVHVLVLASSLWRGLGSLEAAVAFVRQARAHVTPDDIEGLAMVSHQQAKLLHESGEQEKALRVVGQSLASYRKKGDAYGEGRALVLRARILERLEQIERAMQCIQEVLKLSKRHGHKRVELYGHLERGRLLANTGSVREGLEALGLGLGQATALGDRNAEFLAHFHLSKAYERLGDGDRSRFEYNAASYFVQFVDDHSPEADEVRAATTTKGRLP